MSVSHFFGRITMVSLGLFIENQVRPPIVEVPEIAWLLLCLIGIVLCLDLISFVGGIVNGCVGLVEEPVPD